MAIDLMSRGNELLETGSWEEARRIFEEASRHGDVDALMGLATASRWLDDIGASIDALDRAYRGYVETGENVDAATTAFSLAEMFIDYRGEPAVAAGWLQRARHHLKSDPDHPAMVAVGAMEAYLALAYDKDPLEENIGQPFAPSIFAISVFHCLTVSLAYGGEGLGTAWGEQQAREKLANAGFTEIETRQVEGDFLNLYHIARKEG